MTGMAPGTATWRGSAWRKAMWGTAGLLLLLPAVAMQFTREVDWSPSDFVVMGCLLAAACGAVDVGMRLSGHLAYRAGFAAAVGGGCLLVWVNLAVGLIGSEDNPINLLYFAVLLTGAVGAVLARFRAAGLARTLLAMAAVQVAIAVFAGLSGASGEATPPMQLVGVTLFFLGPWLLASALFHVAARDAARGGA